MTDDMTDRIAVELSHELDAVPVHAGPPALARYVSARRPSLFRAGSIAFVGGVFLATAAYFAAAPAASPIRASLSGVIRQLAPAAPSPTPREVDTPKPAAPPSQHEPSPGHEREQQSPRPEPEGGETSPPQARDTPEVEGGSSSPEVTTSPAVDH